MTRFKFLLRFDVDDFSAIMVFTMYCGVAGVADDNHHCMIGFELAMIQKVFCTDSLLNRLSVQNNLFFQNWLFVQC